MEFYNTYQTHFEVGTLWLTFAWNCPLTVRAMREVTPGIYSPDKTPVLKSELGWGDDYETLCRKAANASKFEKKTYMRILPI